MYTETDGIVIKKVRLTNGKNMLTLFTKKFGKISAASNITENNRSKSSMAVRPFSYSRFEMYKNPGSYNIINGELLRSYYKIGEDIDKYVQAAYVMEYTDKILAEGTQANGIYDLILDYFDMIVRRKDKYSTLTIAYQLKTLKYLGIAPVLAHCANCTKRENPAVFSVKDGGVLCVDCLNEAQKIELQKNKNGYKNDEMLIYSLNFDIINAVTYILNNPLKALESVTLKPEIEKGLRHVLRQYVNYHLDIGKLKTESFCWID